MSNVIRNPRSYTPTNPVGLDARIEAIREALTALPWLEHSLGRAFLRGVSEVIAGNETTVNYPLVYLDNGEYFNVMPNDAVKSFSFLIGKDNTLNVDPERPPFAQFFKLSTPLDLIFFFRYDLIDSSIGQPFDQQLIQDVLSVLKNQQGLTLTAIVNEDIRNVYAGYDLRRISRDLLMFPYGAFRFELNVTYEVICN